MARHILVPVDESDRSDEAFSYALDEYAGDRITALHVVDPRNVYTAVGVEDGMMSAGQLHEQLDSQADAVLSRCREEAERRGVDIDTVRITGTIASSIVRYAENQAIDHIVMGSHGRSGASRILLGSVAERVTRRSPVAVTIVR